MKKIFPLTALLATLALGSCNKEYLNPSTASQQQAVSTPDGLIALCNGLQFRYSAGGLLSVVYNTVAASGLSAGELRVLNVGQIEEFNVSQGGSSLINNNGVVRNLWTGCQLVKANADLILANAAIVPEAGTRGAIVAHASIFRALALGTQAQYFEQLPLAVQTNAPFVDRVAALRSAVTQLEAAATLLAAAPVSADFNGKIVAGLDLPNTVQALIARYSLELGDFDKALAAAGRVDLARRSVFNYDDNARNPVFETSFGNKNLFEPSTASLGLTGALAPETGDRRIPSLVRLNLPANSPLNLGTGFYTANSAPIPVYVPGEMLLIRAEAYARKDDLANAVIELNKVRTNTAAAVTTTTGLLLTLPGAALPAYAGPVTAPDVLTDILRNRSIELAFQGFRLADSRRFGRPGPGAPGTERNRNFYPYPRVERENNPATPADPVL